MNQQTETDPTTPIVIWKLTVRGNKSETQTLSSIQLIDNHEALFERFFRLFQRKHLVRGAHNFLVSWELHRWVHQSLVEYQQAQEHQHQPLSTWIESVYQQLVQKLERISNIQYARYIVDYEFLLIQLNFVTFFHKISHRIPTHAKCFLDQESSTDSTASNHYQKFIQDRWKRFYRDIRKMFLEFNRNLRCVKVVKLSHSRSTDDKPILDQDPTLSPWIEFKESPTSRPNSSETVAAESMDRTAESAEYGSPVTKSSCEFNAAVSFALEQQRRLQEIYSGKSKSQLCHTGIASTSNSEETQTSAVEGTGPIDVCNASRDVEKCRSQDMDAVCEGSTHYLKDYCQELLPYMKAEGDILNVFKNEFITVETTKQELLENPRRDGVYQILEEAILLSIPQWQDIELDLAEIIFEFYAHPLRPPPPTRPKPEPKVRQVKAVKEAPVPQPLKPKKAVKRFIPAVQSTEPAPVGRIRRGAKMTDGERWRYVRESLKGYYILWHHTNMDRDYVLNGEKLGAWAHQQRIDFKKNLLQPWQVELLEEVDFDFEWGMDKTHEGAMETNRS